MPAPSIDLVHLKTSRQHNNAGTLIYRYWFEWQNRRQLGNTVVRIDLLDAEANVITNVTVRLPKVKITGYIPATDDAPQKPIYDSSVWIQVDDIARPTPAVAAQYHTVSNVFSRSDTVTVPLNGVFDDLSMAL